MAWQDDKSSSQRLRTWTPGRREQDEGRSGGVSHAARLVRKMCMEKVKPKVSLEAGIV